MGNITKAVPVTGMAHYGHMDFPFKVGDRLDLEPDPGNAHDANAIKVLLPNGKQIGWVSRHYCGQLATYMRQYPRPTHLVITQYKPHKDGHGNLERMVCAVQHSFSSVLPDIGKDRDVVHKVPFTRGGSAYTGSTPSHGEVWKVEVRTRPTPGCTTALVSAGYGTGEMGYVYHRELPDGWEQMHSVMVGGTRPEVWLSHNFSKLPAAGTPDEVKMGGSQVGKTTAMEQSIRRVLSLPHNLRLMHSVPHRAWLISEDGTHWLHLVDDHTTSEKMEVARRYAFENYESHYPADFYLRKEQQNKTQIETQTQPPKETTMLNRTSISTILSTNKNAATSAAYSEAGRIANNAFAGFAASKAPFMIKGYIDTPFGKLLLANIASVAQRELRPNDARLAKLTEAMLSQAFVALYQDFDIEGALAKLMDSTEIKRALGKLDESEAGAADVKAGK